MPVTSYAEMYEFHIDPDKLSGAPVVKLNKPLTKKDVIHVYDGHFYTVGFDLLPGTTDDKRVRFWGVNLAPPLTFPRDNIEANKLAGNLAKMGFNIVRLHGLDNVANKQYMTLLKTSPKTSFEAINKENLEALDRLVDALQSHGIYIDLGLKVGYTFGSEKNCYINSVGKNRCIPDPEETTQQYSIPREMPAGSRPLDLFNHEMKVLQKKYFKALLEHYKDHPVLALVEINNENSLIEYFWKSPDAMPPLYAAELDRLWNSWLLEKYSNTHALRTAWKPAIQEGRDIELIKNGNFHDHRLFRQAGIEFYC